MSDAEVVEVGPGAPVEPHYRVGRSVGRTLYRDDVLFGLVDTPELAARVVAALNAESLCPDCGQVAGRCKHTNVGYAQALLRLARVERENREIYEERRLAIVARDACVADRAREREEHLRRVAELEADVRRERALGRWGSQEAASEAERIVGEAGGVAIGGAAAGFLTPEAMERWKRAGSGMEAHEGPCVHCGRDEASHQGFGSGCGEFVPLTLASARERIADLEGEVQRLAEARRAERDTERDVLVAQLADAREEAVEAGQRAEALEGQLRRLRERGRMARIALLGEDGVWEDDDDAVG